MNDLRARVTVALLLCGSALAGCNGESATGSGGGGGGGGSTDGWAGHAPIEAILEKNCSGCHGTQFSSCWDVQSGASEIEGAVASGAMPRSGGMSASDKAALLHWLRQGAECSGKRPEGSGGGGTIGSGQPPVGY